MVGPLASYAPGFDRELRSRGYTRLSAVLQLRLMAHVSRWLASEELDGAAFTPERVEEFCGVRRRAGYTALLTPRALAPLQEFLRGRGVLAEGPKAPAPVSEKEQLLARYRDHLVGERGLVPAVVSRYLKAAALFLDQVPGGVVGRPALDAAAVSVFCARELPRNSRANAANLASALRSFLRFLHLEGMVGAPVAQAVPAVANRKGQGLPRALPPATVARLLASCDRRTRLGRRDYAMLMLLARLGLRAGEVASLSLDDIGWRSGELTVHGKGGRDDRLPLPADVGAALAAWLRIRPKAQTRAVFLRANAPIGAISPGASPGLCITPATGPGSPGPARTGSATAWQPRCWEPGRRSPRSARFCGTPGWRRPRSTRRSTIVRWMHSCCPGRGTGRERAGAGGRAGGVPGGAPLSWLQAGS
jgi:site-specific recombinase XerC